MQVRNAAIEQHIAVFGESGSGKTVLVSSFYGSTQQQAFKESHFVDVFADDLGQGAKLYRDYLGMRDDATVPAATKFAPTSYAFTMKPKKGANPKAGKRAGAATLRLVWHDYPGEWFEQEATGEEARRRVDTFRSLLSSDVALLLVDGQRLLDHRGEEERYLKSLFTNMNTGLRNLEDEILDGGKPLVRFPRIWILALSKADLLPQTNVDGFRDLLIAKASDEILELRQTLKSLVQGPEALSFGEDFMLLSSAHFEPGRIEVNRQIGLDLVLPIASILPFERQARWAKAPQLPAQVAKYFAENAGTVVNVLNSLAFLIPGPVGKVFSLVSSAIARDTFERGVTLLGERLVELNEEAIKKREYLVATLTQFTMALDRGEDEKVLLRSRR